MVELISRDIPDEVPKTGTVVLLDRLQVWGECVREVGCHSTEPAENSGLLQMHGRLICPHV